MIVRPVTRSRLIPVHSRSLPGKQANTMSKRRNYRIQSGFTLVELIVSIVVIAVAVTGVLLAVQFSTRHSADPMIRQQAVAIADAYMEEIMLRPYEDPGGSDSGRSTYDDVFDYNGTDEPPRDQTGDPLSELENYHVEVEVEHDTLGPSDSDTDAAKITVTVTHQSADVEFALTGYKTQY